MKAIVHYEFGAPEAVLKVEEVDRPEIGEDEVLVRVRASSANPYDWHFIRAEPVFIRLGPAGLRRPKLPTPGGDLAGTVEEVGASVETFKPGDEVYGFQHGAFAEYHAVPQGRLWLKPANVDFEQVGAIPLAAITELQGLRDVGGIEAGDKVLIVGASGGVGTFAVQIAKAFGAEVTGVCSTRNVELVRSIGADHVVDYTATDYTQGDARYDLVFQLGGIASASSIRRVMAPNGTLVLSSGDGGRLLGPIGNMTKAMLSSPFVSQSMKVLSVDETSEDLAFLKDLIEAGKVTPVIDSSYPLAETGKAVALVEDGSPQGKVVITIA